MATEESAPEEVSMETVGSLAQPLLPLLPKGFEWVWTKVTGKTILILGPARAGKTSFINYFRRRLLLPEQPSSKTLTVKKHQSFVRKLGKEGELVVRVKAPLDVPGEMSPYHQVQYIETYKPDCIVLVLDSTTPLQGHSATSSISWLDEFCQQLSLSLNDSKKIRKKLRTVIVLMNKWDKISSNKAKEKFKAEVKRVITLYQKQSLNSYQGTQNIPILPCASVKSKLETKLIDEAIDMIGNSLYK